MATINLPNEGDFPWDLNPAITAINSEVEATTTLVTTGRLSENGVLSTITSIGDSRFSPAISEWVAGVSYAPFQLVKRNDALFLSLTSVPGRSVFLVSDWFGPLSPAPLISLTNSGDGTYTLTSFDMTANGNGTYSLTSPNLTPNGDGSFTLAA